MSKPVHTGGPLLIDDGTSHLHLWISEEMRKLDAALWPHDDDEEAIEDRIDRVCDDLTAGRVVPSKRDQLEAAVQKTRQDEAVHRAMRAR